MAGKPHGMDLASLDRGRARHPLFGRYKSKSGEDLWFDTNFKAGWWTDTLTRAADQKVKARIVDEMSKVLDQIASGKFRG